MTTRSRTKTALGLAVAAYISCGIGLRATPPITEVQSQTNAAAQANNAPKAGITDSSVTNIVRDYIKKHEINAVIGTVKDSWDGKEAVKVVVITCISDNKGNKYRQPADICLCIDGNGKIKHEFRTE